MSKQKYRFGGHGEKIIAILRRELKGMVSPNYESTGISLVTASGSKLMAIVDDEQELHCVFERPIPIIDGVTEEREVDGSFHWHYRGNSLPDLMMLVAAAYRNLKKV